MTTEDPRILELRRVRAKALEGGGEDRIRKQKAKGKLTAPWLGPGRFCARYSCRTALREAHEDHQRVQDQPLIGALGISAFPMAGRLAAEVANDEDRDNFILMHAMGANTAGQLGSVIAVGVLLAIVTKFV